MAYSDLLKKYKTVFAEVLWPRVRRRRILTWRWLRRKFLGSAEFHEQKDAMEFLSGPHRRDRPSGNPLQSKLEKSCDY